MWKGFCIFICCFFSWYCGNFRANSESVIKHDESISATDILGSITSQREKNKNLIVELEVDSDDSDDENDENDHVLTPTIAPATPQLFFHSSSRVDTSLSSPILSQIQSIFTPAVKAASSVTPSTMSNTWNSETTGNNTNAEGVQSSSKLIDSEEKFDKRNEDNANVLESYQDGNEKESTQTVEESDTQGKVNDGEAEELSIPSTIENSLLSEESKPRNRVDIHEKEESIASNILGDKKEDGKMVSFTEWKQKHDREKEIKEKELDVEQEIVKASEGISNSTEAVDIKTKKKKKLSKNYASPNCGAKVITANGEAQNINAILTEDKDFYMLNPCNVQAWVVIELCERIQLYSIDFANFEMFSSTPEVFTIHVSNRFPTRDWELIQHFQAKSAREVQTFHVKEKFYAKYIKFEVLKNTGKEHYCPLSLLRVFGMTEVEEFENENDDIHTEDEAETSAQAKNEDTDGGIFESAKQAVVGLVNNVAKTLTGEKEKEKNVNETISSKIVTLMSHNDHFIEYFEDSSFITTCIQRTLYSEYNASLNPVCQLGLTYMLIKRMCPSLSFYQSSRSMKSSFDDINSIQRKKESVLPIPPPPPKKIDGNDQQLNEEANQNLFVKVPVTNNNDLNIFATKRDMATTLSPSVTTKDQTCSSQQHPLIDITKFVENLPQPSFISERISSKTVTITKALKVTPSQDTTSVLHINLEPTIAVKLIGETSKAKEDSVDVLEFKVNHTDGTSVVAEKVIDEKSNALEDQTSTVDEQSVERSKPTNEPVAEMNEANKKDTKPNQIPSLASSTLKEEKSINVNVAEPAIFNPIQPKHESLKIEEQTEMPVISENSHTSSATSSISSQENEKPFSNKAKTTQPIGGLTGSKESIVVKLSAKIKALQENLTMSMMYLEEMSERYRTAVEEVDERHKKNAIALNINLKSQQDIIQYQSKLISNLTKTIASLTTRVQNMTDTLDKQNETLTEKHVFWIMIEIILVLFFCTFCGRRIPETSPSQIGTNRIETNKIKCGRVITHSSKNESTNIKKKKRSHSNVEQPYIKNDYSSIEDIELEVSKRKKRKKQIPISPKVIKETRLSKTAGLLFYAGKGILSGLTGALYYGTEIVKPSRRADALIDPIHKPGISKKEKLRRTRSTELSTVLEELPTADELQIVPMSFYVSEKEIERPKSADAIVYTRKQKSKSNSKAVARFA